MLRGRPILQAERALCATARPRRAAALRGCERDASGRCPWGPPGILEQTPPPPLEGASEIIHREAVAQRRPHTGRHSQAPDPRVLAVRPQAHKLQHHLAACRKEWAGRKPRAHAAPQGEE